MTNNHPARILYYCQSLAGIGHLTASLHVIRELLQHSDVDLIYGGHRIDINLEHHGFRHISLPTILINEATGCLYTPNQQYSVDQLWLLRAQQITAFLFHHYDAAVVEFFPFGRRKFKKEILSLFRQLRDHNPRIPVFTFVREVLVPEPMEVEQRIVQLINDHIHTVFIRGDSNVIRFEETFSLTGQIADKICYLGYLGSRLSELRPARTKQILVSQGGGSRGRELLESAIRTAPVLPHYQFVIATGAQTTVQDFAHLADLVSSDNVKIVPFLKNFRSQLLESALSISLGGDNTLIDVISTHTPGLAFPYPGDSEQAMRINKLAQKGFIHSLCADDLVPGRLHEKIVHAIGLPCPEVEIAMGGAVKMSEQIKAVLASIATGVDSTAEL
jgi:predicted glycosyltransferase